MICFGMVTTGRSRRYTLPALASFFRHTELSPADRFILIDNDGDFELPPGFPRVETIRHARPQSFAANANIAIRRAAAESGDVVFLNNDVIFTPGWLEPLRGSDRAILIPLCNQQIPYEHGALKLKPQMDWEDYDGREADLAAIVAAHRANPRFAGLWHDIHLSFYCFRLPHAVLASVGPFDEEFGFGGGEDIDYRLRAHLAGFDTLVALNAYLLHFAGKSTWRGGETAGEIRARTDTYVERFTAKWGGDLARLFLFNKDWRAHAARLGVETMIDSGDYRGVIGGCLAMNPDRR